MKSSVKGKTKDMGKTGGFVIFGKHLSLATVAMERWRNRIFLDRKLG
jgi:hypothetical protein